MFIGCCGSASRSLCRNSARSSLCYSSYGRAPQRRSGFSSWRTLSDSIAGKLHGWADKKWPAWPVAPGLLTPRGFYLVKATWELNRSRSPFTYGVCPKPEDVQIIADVDERTRKTAEALNEGLYPTCGYKVKVTSSARSAIFSPLKAKVCRLTIPKNSKRSSLKKLSGSTKSLRLKWLGSRN